VTSHALPVEGDIISMNTIHNDMARDGKLDEHGGKRQDEPVVGQHERLHTDAHMDANIGNTDLPWQECPMGFRGIPVWEERMTVAGTELE
jgi:hypothetical protein